MRPVAACVIAVSLAAPVIAADPKPAWEQAVADAAAKPPMTAAEARAFMRRLTEYVAAHHLKTDPNSPQRGMVYEYFDTTRAGRPDRWVQGEALDTMHDGAWLAVALVSAARATSDPYYTEFLTKWQLPFYTRVLNHSDTLFDAQQVDVDPTGVRFNKEHALIPGEKGFCPYWWDDGASVSLERRRKPGLGPPFACTNLLAGKVNPTAALAGYSHGCSNHMAQDLAVMLQQGWLLLRDDPEHKKLADDVALAAKHLHESRLGHHGVIPMVAAAAALTNGDAKLMAKVPAVNPKARPANHYTRFLGAVGTTQKHSTPGFADDTQYLYYQSLARSGAKLPREILLKVIYDAYTEPMLFRYWSDNAGVPAGLNRFDLIGHTGTGGRFDSYRSDKQVPFGSRFGPQNMVVCGWAAQALKADPKLWDEEVKRLTPGDVIVAVLDTQPTGERPVTGVEAFVVGNVKLGLTATRTALTLEGSFVGPNARIDVIPRPDVKGPFATVTLAEGRPVAAVNDKGQALRVSGTLEKRLSNGHVPFRVELPFSVNKDQKPWGNGVELGWYAIRVKETKTATLASPGDQVRKSVERELAAGLRTWEAIFDAKGYIPTGLNAGGDWDKFSDSGGYAHLIAAAAQYLLLLDGKADWDTHAPPTFK